MSFRLAFADSLANFAASLGAGKDKLAGDEFFLTPLSRYQAEAMYRGDWLARKIVDIVPYDMCREWREWEGDDADIDRIEALEKKLGYRKIIQRAMTLGRLYGGAAVIIGTRDKDPKALATELVAEDAQPGDIAFLHVVNRWQVTPFDLIRDPLSPYFGEPSKYQLVSQTSGTVELHPSRVVRFLGNELPDPIDRPTTDGQGWGDSILQAVYDAVHDASLTSTGIASLVHEAKTDVINVPDLASHLETEKTTAQLTKRFSYASSIKSINNILLLDKEEVWNRQQINFSNLPDVLRLYLQIAAGAADIPVTRLLGQSPAGMSATGESDTRNYYDMLSSRQEVDMRPQIGRLDEMLIRSTGVDPEAVSYEFRPLWQLSETEKADVRLKKAQTSVAYANAALLPEPVLQKAVEGQLVEDGVYPNLKTIVEEFEAENPDWQEEQAAAAEEAAPGQPQPAADSFDPNQPRGPDGKWIGAEIERLFEAVGKSHIERVAIARPTDIIAKKIETLFGIDVSSLPIMLSNENLTHIMRRHGPKSNDRSPVDRSDIVALPSILSAANRVRRGEISNVGAKRAIMQARIETGNYTIVIEIQRRKRRLEIVTMRKR